MKFHFYQDPGHGWLKVPRRLLVQMGLIKKISPYSCQRKDFVYLEEDADMTMFETLWKRVLAPTKGDLDYKVYTTDRNSRIRGYASFAPHVND